jgi:hypothetical protein
MNLHTNHENNKKLQTMEAGKNKFEERSGGSREWPHLIGTRGDFQRLFSDD